MKEGITLKRLIILTYAVASHKVKAISQYLDGDVGVFHDIPYACYPASHTVQGYFTITYPSIAIPVVLPWEWDRNSIVCDVTVSTYVSFKIGQ